MEASERETTIRTSAKQELVTMAPDVDHGTFSTGTPPEAASTASLHQKDGSVVSAMTDPASLEGQGTVDLAPLLTGNESPVPSDTEVPAQVILEEKDENVRSPDDDVNRSNGPEEPAPVVDTRPTPENDSVVSTPAAPESGPALKVDTSLPVTRARTSSGVSNEEDADDYIRSPEVQNAIVERSPGGRYVRFMEKLGSGASKDVYRAYDTQEGIEVAWNVVNLSGVPKTERNRIVNEVRLLERLHHRNIISFHGSWVNRERQEVNFVTEILSSGTLKSFIAKVQVIRWKIAKRWAVQILKGLEYLHSQDPPVIHRDLKCENIFINGTSGDLRIGDLGLSTVHRNERVLSVLGTPEFMAPDMYEENSYDERVDIYAFGMCMLEILTKEIPYRECKNPAQIYKKVSSGEPPDVLSRLQSRHAREFVILCLGYKDEDGRFVRPSATELLQHPFLVKRPNDEDEVVVDRPLHERAIPEAGESSTSPGGTPSSKKQASASGETKRTGNSQSPSKTESNTNGSSSNRPAPQAARSSNSLDDYEGDTFEEMPQSETNMKKVKVMMGRDQELEEDDSSVQELEKSQSTDSKGKTGDSNSARTDRSEAPTEHYLVAAAVIENEAPDARPYPDDVLKLVVTLPVEGQTQNVQFGFHLVEDDPVKVAKEMVQELGIPQGAVLEISETISGLACAARMKVDKFNSKAPTSHVQLHSHAQTGLVQTGQIQHHMEQTQQQAVPVDQGMQMPVQPQPAMYVQPQHAAYVNAGDAGHPQQQLHPPVAAHTAQVQPLQPIPYAHPNGAVSHAPPAPSQNQPAALSLPPASRVSLPRQTAPSALPPQHNSIAGIVHQHGSSQSLQSTSAQGSQSHQSLQPQPTPVPGVAPPQGATMAAHQGVSQTPAVGQRTSPPQQRVTPQSAVAQGSHMPAQPGVAQPQVAQAPAAEHSQPAPLSQGSAPPQQSVSTLRTNVQTTTAARVHGQHVQGSGQGVPSVALQSTASSLPNGASEGKPVAAQPISGPQTSPNLAPSAPPRPVQRAATSGATLSNEALPKRRERQVSMNGTANEPLLAGENLEHEDDPSLKEELRKLDEDYQRNLHRAQKVYDNRMDNLQRSQIEREAQHQKIVEKHEKERADYERRLAQEAEQQSRRIEQLQREWDKKRETLAQEKRKQSEEGTAGGKKNGIHPAVATQEGVETTPLVLSSGGMHRRTGSSASSSTSLLAAANEQTQPTSQQQ